ncbi:hypothetical protein V8C86DRAFT_2448805 [Haematococcus lacustris]
MLPLSHLQAHHHQRLKHADAAHTAGDQHLSGRLLLDWERRGHTTIKGLLEPQVLHDVKQDVTRLMHKHKLAALRQRVRVLCPEVQEVPGTEAAARSLIRRHGSSSLGFLQFFHNWRQSEAVRALVTSPQLAGAAAQLLGAPRLRLYQDCVFYKEPGFGMTNWHSDLRMAPFDTNDFVTAWIPLQPIHCLPAEPPSSRIEPAADPDLSHPPQAHHTQPDQLLKKAGRQQGGARKGEVRAQAQHSQLLSAQTAAAAGLGSVSGRADSALRSALPHTDEQQEQRWLQGQLERESGLLFASGSHRDFALPFWHSLQDMDLGGRQYRLRGTGPMELGDVSFHHGWLLHCAGAQRRGTRVALAVSYFADGARLLQRAAPTVHSHMLHNEDEESYQDWLPDLADGALAQHPLLPIAWP